ncbi:MAG: N-6 DNA methylase, partial [Flavobacteriaceae bacterium]
MWGLLNPNKPMAAQNANSNLHAYIQNINRLYVQGRATEHSYRGDLAQLIEAIVPDIKAINEPKRQACGAPDYILERNQVPIGFIEAKDVGDKDLDGAKKSINKEQFDRYKASLDNLIFTDYIDFHLYQNGEFVSKIAIGEITAKGIVPLPQQFEPFENLLKDFCTHIGQHIRSAKKLAQFMAGKARLLSDIIGKALLSDEENHENSTLKEQYEAFKQILIHDITPEGFADVYAQTIAYGMFAARLHDPTLQNFNRQEAAELIPKTNPFLRKLFGYIAGPDIDDRIKWVVENLSDIFLACNVAELLKNYGKSTKTEDPIIHFYETFLAEYDPKLRKARGVWYTPQPVVDFIVRAVDDILKTEFDLPQGLADTSKVPIKVNVQGEKTTKEVHRVQILDPATGTGTFLAEVIKHIYKGFAGQQGLWSNYVENHLLPRLNGFELLMASYAMAHLKLDLLLTETKFAPTTLQRFRVYLTNSLEAYHPDTGTLFANWLSTEANEANHIKRDTPVMCVIGNPPYAVSSTNKNDWIENLIADYKKDLNEKSYNSLSDDYVKFIRYGQHYIEKNGSGVLAYISNNSFVDGIVFRKMRENLLECFDKIYILDLHGNAKKKEVCPDGSPDQNVFDIMQGVSINIFVKIGNKKKTELGQLYNHDLYGKRDFKYKFLTENKLSSVNWSEVNYQEPSYLFQPQDYALLNTYN